MTARPPITMSYDEAHMLLTSLETTLATVKHALADLKCGKTNLAACRLETLVTLDPTRAYADIVAHNVAPFRSIGEIIGGASD